VRILYFYQYFTTPRGAWGTRAYEFARRWVRAGDQVTIVTSVYDKSDLKPTGLVSRVDVEGIDVRVINLRLSNKHGFVVRILTFAAYALVASWFALRIRADVVVSSSGPITVGIPGLLARYLRGRPLVFEVRDLWPEGSIQLGLLRNRPMIRVARAFERLCYRASARVVALSDGMAAWIRREYGIDHLDVVPNACDNELFGAPPVDVDFPAWAAGRHLVVYTGTMGLMDDCLQIVRMAASLAAQGIDDIAVVLIGDGAERLLIERDIAQRGLANVHCLGLVPKPIVAGWLNRASCALLAFRPVPCLDTVSPNKMFDAFAAGVPVVQATHGWIKDLLARERCGLTVPPNDPHAMADAVVRLVRDTQLQRAYAASARRVARELFARDPLAAKMREVLALAASGRATKATEHAEVASSA
jgi:glycosyltransferase involved in cell wall biosynthesis